MNLQFIEGKAIIKNGRKTVAKIYDRKVFYTANNIPLSYSPKFPFSLEMNAGIRECESLEDAIFYLNKYTNL